MLRQLPPIGMRWPETCNLCGAPLMNRRCPRCGYERAKQGESIYTGVHAEGGIAVAPRIVSLGSVTGTTPTITIPNVEMPVDWMLIVFAGISGDTNEIQFSTASWGPNALNSTLRIYNADATLYVDTLYLLVTSAIAGTNDLVVSNNDSHREQSFALAHRVSGPRSYRQSWLAQATTPQSQASLTIAQDLTDLEFYPIWVKNAVSDPGAWSSNGEAGSGLVLGGTFAPGHISCFIGNIGQHGAVTVTKNLSPSAAYFMPAAEFFNP